MFEMDSQSENWTNIMNSINMTCDMVKWIIIFLFIFNFIIFIIFSDCSAVISLKPSCFAHAALSIVLKFMTLLV